MAKQLHYGTEAKKSEDNGRLQISKSSERLAEHQTNYLKTSLRSICQSNRSLFATTYLIITLYIYLKALWMHFT